METALLILAKTVQVLLSVVSLAMIVRMLLPFFSNPEESRVYALTCYITEPFIIPVRYILAKLNIGQDSPFDWSFFVTYLIIWALEAFLPAV